MSKAKRDLERTEASGEAAFTIRRHLKKEGVTKDSAVSFEALVDILREAKILTWSDTDALESEFGIDNALSKFLSDKEDK